MTTRLLTGALAGCIAFAQSSPHQSKVDAIFAGFTRTTPGCAVGVSENGTTVLRAGYGMADLEREVPITPDSVFESGSVAKQFTAAALMLLAQQGKLSLDDPLRKHLPELPDYGAPLTIRHVIHHTSGLREWRPIARFSGMAEGTYVLSNEDLLAFAARQRGLNFDPGTNYTYSNTGFNIAAILVQRVLGGKTFQAFTKEAIFDPLGMTNTRWRDNFRAVIPRRAIAYGRTGGAWIQQQPIENIIGAGGMLTTVDDLLRWNENFTHARVGGPDFVRAQQQPAKLADGRSIRYAAGLMVDTVNGLREVSHGGATGGYRTWLGRYPEKGVSVAVLCNSAEANTAALGRNVARLWTRAEVTPRRTSYTANPEKLAAMAGMYRKVRDNTVVRMQWRDGRLSMSPNLRLTPVADGRFGIGESGGELICEASCCKSSADDAPVYEKVDPASPSAAELAALAGEYRSQEATAVIDVTARGRELRLRVRGTPDVRLEPTFRDAFRMTDGSSIRFWRDASGKVTALSAGSDRVWDLRFDRVK